MYKLCWLRALVATVREERESWSPFVVLGDFNIVPTDTHVWDIAEFSGSSHVTDSERAALVALRDAGLIDIYPRALKARRTVHPLGLPAP